MEQPATVPEPEVREITSPPPSENEATAEEVFDHPETVDAEEEEHEGPGPVHVDTTTPVIEEPESPMVQTAPAPAVQESESPGDQPKKSYASIVSDVFLF